MHNNLRYHIISSFILVLMFTYFVPQNTKTPIKENSISKAQLLGQISASKQTNFSIIERPYTNKANMYMNTQAYNAYKKMYADAAKEGLDLKIVSAFRSFYHQKAIWEAKWTGRTKVLGQDLSKKYPNAEARAKVILMFSSMPGTSRHHWGTDMDINNFTNAYFEKGKGYKEYQWLLENAAKYGFCQPYTEKGVNRPEGYNEEKWHWSYVPIAGQLTKLAKRKMKDDMITGFLGANTASSIGIVEKYILGVNPVCK